MPPGLTVVFPRAATTGGVERVVAEFLRFQARRGPVAFVGESLEIPDARATEVIRVQLPRVPNALRPWAFRRAAAKALTHLAPTTTVSFGVECPPGDVYWVGSVHRAWVEKGGQIRFRGLYVPGRVRLLMPRHRVLLRLEHDYFVNHRPCAIVCTSQREVDDLERYYGVRREIMHVIPNGYDPAAFNPSRREVEREAMRARIGARPDDVVLLMVANEWHRKGLGTLLEAVAAVRNPRLRIDLVGAKPPRDYLSLVERYGLADRVHWHGPSDDVGAFMAAADVFVLPTTYEPFGMVIIEAMASGLPVVTSRLAGAATAIDHGRNGLLLDDPTDAHELAAALTVLINEVTRADMGVQAGASVDDYVWSRVFERAEGIVFDSSHH